MTISLEGHWTALAMKTIKKYLNEWPENILGETLAERWGELEHTPYSKAWGSEDAERFILEKNLYTKTWLLKTENEKEVQQSGDDITLLLSIG